MNVDQVKATYQHMMDEHGEWIVIRRYTGQGTNRPKFDISVRAVVRNYMPEELVGDIQQGDRQVVVLAKDIIDKQLRLPITTNDRAIVRDKELAIRAPDDSSVRVGPHLVAYKFNARG